MKRSTQSYFLSVECPLNMNIPLTAFEEQSENLANFIIYASALSGHRCF